MLERKNRDQPTDNMDFRWIYIDGGEFGSGFNSPEHDWDIARISKGYAAVVPQLRSPQMDTYG